MLNMPDISEKKQRLLLQRAAITPETLQLIPETVARTYSVIPLEVTGSTLRIAMANTSDIFALEAVESRTHLRVEPVAAEPGEVLSAIDFFYQSSYGDIEKQLSGLSSGSETLIEELMPDTAADAPISKALTLIIDEAIKSRASDIHIQPEEDCVRIRYRIDGTLHEKHILPLQTAVPLISRIKILAKMNIADHHRPQDGQLSVKPKDRPAIDIRVGTIPIINGEMAALRLLDKSKAVMTLTQLGFRPDSLKRYEEMLQVPYGMILVTGPTGAGKTTTLYASLNGLDRKGRNILTIEDPVEYHFKNINQIQVNARAGLTFAAGLRSILRLDPDVILVGEIRDAETANIAVQSALTGHLVLSSIHANDSVGVISRLLDLGVEPFLIASALVGVVAQRMGRRVCPACAEMTGVSVVEQHAYTRETGEERKEFLIGKGCKSCSDTGYQGRIGFFEIMKISENIRSMILERANTTNIREQAVKEGMIALIKDGMLKAKDNITNPAEVLRNAYTSD